jgi:pyruvate formate lyase activating enzyme
MDIRGFVANSLLEWEDRVAAVVVTGGCNWRCPYCHGWRFVLEPDKLLRVDEDEIIRRLATQGEWLDGVVISGGEPTLQSDLPAFIARVREETGLAVKLHTNGSRPEVLRPLLDDGLLACLALDYKAPLDARLSKAAGRELSAAEIADVAESFRLAAASGIGEYHTTLCPRFVDFDTFAAMAERLKDNNGLWILQRYAPDDCLDPEAAGAERYDDTALERFLALARERYNGKVLLRR